jgi:hypothetical protein
MTDYLSAQTYHIFQQLIYKNYVADNVDYKQYCVLYTDWFKQEFGPLTLPKTVYYFGPNDVNEKLKSSVDGIQPNLTISEFLDVKKEGADFTNMQIVPSIFLYRWIDEFNAYALGMSKYEINIEGIESDIYFNPSFFNVNYMVYFNAIPPDRVKLIK